MVFTYGLCKTTQIRKIKTPIIQKRALESWVQFQSFMPPSSCAGQYGPHTAYKRPVVAAKNITVFQMGSRRGYAMIFQ